MIHVLTGPKHSGKTTFLKGMSCALKEMSVILNGFLSLGVREKGAVLGYDLYDLVDGKTTPLLRKEGDEHRQRAGPYYLMPKGLEEAERILFRKQEVDLLIVDEVGILEMRGQGLWPALSKKLFAPHINCLIVVQERILDDFLQKMGDRKVDLCHLKDGKILTRPGE